MAWEGVILVDKQIVVSKKGQGCKKPHFICRHIINAWSRISMCINLWAIKCVTKVQIITKNTLEPEASRRCYTLVFNTLRLYTKEDLTHRLCFPVVYPPPGERIDFPGEREWKCISTGKVGGGAVFAKIYTFSYAVQRCFLRCPPSARTYFSWMEVRRNDRSTQKHPPSSAVKQNKLSKRADSAEAALKKHTVFDQQLKKNAWNIKKKMHMKLDLTKKGSMVSGA